MVIDSTCLLVGCLTAWITNRWPKMRFVYTQNPKSYWRNFICRREGFPVGGDREKCCNFPCGPSTCPWPVLLDWGKNGIWAGVVPASCSVFPRVGFHQFGSVSVVQQFPHFSTIVITLFKHFPQNIPDVLDWPKLFWWLLFSKLFQWNLDQYL